MTVNQGLHLFDPLRTLGQLARAGSDRKLRLFAVACCRRVTPWISDRDCLDAVDVSEQYADGQVGRKKLNAARRAAYSASKAEVPLSAHAALVVLTACAAKRIGAEPSQLTQTAGGATSLVLHAAGAEAFETERQHQVLLVRDMFDNHFRQIAFDPRWRTADAVALARQMYDGRDFGPMPILADALMDAGCDADDILAHCRGPGPHVRGCWVVDLVLGKE